MDTFIPNGNYVVIKISCNPIGKYFASNITTEIMLSCHKVWP